MARIEARIRAGAGHSQTAVAGGEGELRGGEEDLHRPDGEEGAGEEEWREEEEEGAGVAEGVGGTRRGEGIGMARRR